MKRLILLALPFFILYSITPTLAQDTPLGDAPVDGATEDQTTVDVLFIACEDTGVVNLNGVAQPGFDIYYQIFSGAGASGEALTTLRRIGAEGEYAFSERIAYQNGATVAPGATASVRIIIAPIDAPEDSVLDEAVDDLQDGCNDAANPLQNSVDAGEPTTDTSSFGIASPDGGFLNGTGREPEPAVVLGPRRSGDAARTFNPGLIFALCDEFYPESDPGIIYDSDAVRIFWYWFADTEERLAQNLARTQFTVAVNGVQLSPTDVLISQPTARDGVVYQFYSAFLGNLRPGFYNVGFRQTWTEPINDGFEDFGAGTANPIIEGTCNFQVVQNPFDFPVGLTNGMIIGSENPPSDYRRAIIENQVEREFLNSTNQNNDTP